MSDFPENVVAMVREHLNSKQVQVAPHQLVWLSLQNSAIVACATKRPFQSVISRGRVHLHRNTIALLHASYPGLALRSEDWRLATSRFYSTDESVAFCPRCRRQNVRVLPWDLFPFEAQLSSADTSRSLLLGVIPPPVAVEPKPKV
jgi:hypothetical protein